MAEDRFCRKCPGEDVSRERFEELIGEYQKSIDADKRAPEKVYEKRLSMCNSCQKYINGMCALCGCFVRIRAALAANCCPDTPSKW